MSPPEFEERIQAAFPCANAILDRQWTGTTFITMVSLVVVPQRGTLVQIRVPAPAVCTEESVAGTVAVIQALLQERGITVYGEEDTQA